MAFPQKLFQLAEEKFGSVTPAEDLLLRAVSSGTLSDYSDEISERNNPNHADNWGNERVLRANYIAWLCTDPKVRKYITHRGIFLKGIRLDGDLRLQFTTIKFPLIFEACSFMGTIYLQQAYIRSLEFQNTITGLIQADGINISGSLIFRNSKSMGGLVLIGAKIHGNMECDESEFINPKGDAINAQCLKVTGNIFMRGASFKAQGIVNLNTATIEGTLDCNKAHFENPDGVVINAEGMRVGGAVLFCKDFIAVGEVNLSGATIKRSLDCSGSKFINPKGNSINGECLDINHSCFLCDDFLSQGSVRLNSAKIGGSLQCIRAKFINPNGVALICDSIKVEGNIFLRDGFKAKGMVRLPGGKIGCNLECDNAEFINPDGEAILADNLYIGGQVFLGTNVNTKGTNFKAKGEVRFFYASVGGNFGCNGGSFINPKRSALTLEGVQIKGHLGLHSGFKARGIINIRDAKIGGNLELNNSEIANNNNIALIADSINIKGNVFFMDCKVSGFIRFMAASIDGNFNCKGSHFQNPGNDALMADGMTVRGAVCLYHGFKSEGTIRLSHASIGRNLECDGGQFIIPKDNISIHGENLQVEGSIFLRNGFLAHGEIRLLGAIIGQTLECCGGQLINPKRMALYADGLKASNVFLNLDFKAEGEVRLANATINNNLYCNKGYFLNPNGCAINAEGIKIGCSVFLRDGFTAVGLVDFAGALIIGHFIWTNVSTPENTILSLANATIGTLIDDSRSWPNKGRLFLNGLIYNSISTLFPIDVKERIKWLHLQPRNVFSPQPFEQLSTVLRKTGYEFEARKILIEKEKTRSMWTKISLIRKLLHYLNGLFFNYGYSFAKIAMLSAVIVVLGSIFFNSGYKSQIVIPIKVEGYNSKSGEIVTETDASYRNFNAFLYSIDVFMPAVDLGQKSYWHLNEDKTWKIYSNKSWELLIPGKYLSYYSLFQAAIGGLFITLFLIWLGKIIRR